MKAIIRKSEQYTEFKTPERCWILESWNNSSDSSVSIARARVEPNVTTQLHCLNGVDERYLIISGSGVVRVGTLTPEKVGPGDVVIIPAGMAQQISNNCTGDLIFYCVCSPRFTSECYVALE